MRNSITINNICFEKLKLFSKFDYELLFEFFVVDVIRRRRVKPVRIRASAVCDAIRTVTIVVSNIWRAGYSFKIGKHKSLN